MINVVFADPGTPVSINPRLYPTSLERRPAKIAHDPDGNAIICGAYYISVAYAC